ncbi:MAG: M48 family metalloprotease [Cytophagaceae bacterium]
MKQLKIVSLGLLFIIPLLFTTCKKGERVNIFSVEDDKKLGADMDRYLEDSLGSKILNPAQFPISYGRLEAIKQQILNSGHVRYKNDFAWQMHLIREDSTLNAFATPGGYIYVYTGLIKFLDSEDHLAGVIGHEIAHSDRRHSTNQLTKVYGMQLLFDIILGRNQGALSQVTGGLIALSFSREAESEADEYSVKYLCTDKQSYEADGAAGFFEKLINLGHSGGVPPFLSTHPSPENRVEKIKEKAEKDGCNTTPLNPPTFQQMKQELF